MLFKFMNQTTTLLEISCRGKTVFELQRQFQLDVTKESQEKANIEEETSPATSPRQDY